MSDEKLIRLGQASRALNVGHNLILSFLAQKGFTIDNNPNAKLTAKQFNLLVEKFGTEGKIQVTPTPNFSNQDSNKEQVNRLTGIKVVPKIDLPVALKPAKRPRLTSNSGSKSVRPGDSVKGNVAKVLASEAILILSKGFIGRLSLFEMSWSFPEAERILKNLQRDQEVDANVLEVDTSRNQIFLTMKRQTEPLSDTIKWHRIERGHEFTGTIREVLNETLLVETEKGLFGLVHKSHWKTLQNEAKVKVVSKNDECNLLEFVPASVELGPGDAEALTGKPHFDFIDSELQSYDAFKRSLLGAHASDEDHNIIRKGFEIDLKIFSPELSHKYPFYLQFERNSGAYDAFKLNGVPYLLGEGALLEGAEEKALALLSKYSYWFRLNQRPVNDTGSVVREFSLYNEEISFFGEVKVSKDGREVNFQVRDFSVAHSFAYNNLNKKRETREGSFLLVVDLRILTPLRSLPIGNKQKDFFETAATKTQCFAAIKRLKLQSGELLRQEGRTLAIMDKFLEYQLSLIENQKEFNVFVERFKQVPSLSGGISIEVTGRIMDTLELEDGSAVNIRLKQQSLRTNQDEKLIKLVGGKVSRSGHSCTIEFSKPINLESLKNGFHVDKGISTNQIKIQREIIQDFLHKRIKIDHIESCLINPASTKTPTISNVDLIDKKLRTSEGEEPGNNQVKAVRKAIGNQNIFMVQGPPGTGKTTVIAEIIQQLVAKGEKILVSGQNHVAVDNVLEKISEVPGLNLLRVGNPDRIKDELLDYNIENLTAQYKVDFDVFLKNQVHLSEAYYRLKTQNLNRETIINRFTDEVNHVSKEYNKLGDLFRQRHFTLREGLEELTESETIAAIESLRAWMQSSDSERDLLLRPLIYNSVDVVFATCIGIRTDAVFRDAPFRFGVVIIDEAGKANIAETLVAIELGEKVIMVGDQKQLPPYIDSTLIDEKEPGSFPNTPYGSGFQKEEILHALKTSFFEFIINRIDVGKFPRANLEMLNFQHRMHPNIGKFVSDSFYDGLLQMGSRTHENRLILPSPFDKEVIFFDTSNMDNPFEQNDGCSYKNDCEAQIISRDILPRLFENGVNPKKVAIIAAYKSQVSNIQNHIEASDAPFKNVEVSTLDSFQGKEYNIIIVSFTRSADHGKARVVDGKKRYTKVGFLDDARRLNVAFSRAKKKLIMVGNEKTLTDKRSHYDGLFNYTDLFCRLVSTSKNHGKFINQVSAAPRDSDFDSFFKTYKTGTRALGIVKRVLKEGEKVHTLVVKVGKKDCILKVSGIPHLVGDFCLATEGQEVAAMIYNILPNRKVFLSLDISAQRALCFDKFVKNLKKEEPKKGKVSNQVDSGFFIKLAPGVDGFLPRTALKGAKLTRDQVIEVRIVNVDKIHRRIKLGL